MELKNLSDSELLLRTERLVKSERKLMHLVLCHIAEVESRELYAELGFDSMYSYLTKKLGYCETSAYSRLQGAKLLRKFPEVAEKLESGVLKFSQLTQVQKCLKQHKQTHGEIITKSEALQVIEKIENQTSYQTQKTLAKELQLPLQVQERLKPQGDNSVRLEITLSQEQFAELKQAKDLLSHVCPDGTWSKVIAHLAMVHNRRKLVGRKLKDNKKFETDLSSDESLKLDFSVMTNTLAALSKAKHLSKTSSTAKLRVKRSPIKITTQRALLKKARHCCEYQDPRTGRKCESRYQLQVDHIQPLALGGKNEMRNFRILCRTHNLLAAKKAGLRMADRSS